MATDFHAAPDVAADRSAEPGLASTFKGIVDDSLALMRQQFAMLKAEIRADFHKVLAGIIPLAAGIAPLLLGGLMLCFTLVHLIHWATTPASAVNADPASVPLWACYAIVSAAFLIVGGVLLAIGVHRLKTVNPLPEETAKALEENIQWLMNQNPK